MCARETAALLVQVGPGLVQAEGYDWRISPANGWDSASSASAKQFSRNQSAIRGVSSEHPRQPQRNTISKCLRRVGYLVESHGRRGRIGEKHTVCDLDAQGHIKNALAPRSVRSSGARRDVLDAKESNAMAVAHPLAEGVSVSYEWVRIGRSVFVRTGTHLRQSECPATHRARPHRPECRLIGCSEFSGDRRSSMSHFPPITRPRWLHMVNELTLGNLREESSN